MSSSHAVTLWCCLMVAILLPPSLAQDSAPSPSSLPGSPALSPVLPVSSFPPALSPSPAPSYNAPSPSSSSAPFQALSPQNDSPAPSPHSASPETSQGEPAASPVSYPKLGPGSSPTPFNPDTFFNPPGPPLEGPEAPVPSVAGEGLDGAESGYNSPGGSSPLGTNEQGAGGDGGLSGLQKGMVAFGVIAGLAVLAAIALIIRQRQNNMKREQEYAAYASTNVEEA